MITLKVLGPGCANCKRLEQIAREAVDSLAIEAKLEKVTETNDIIAYGVMSTPGLVINDKVVSSGRLPAMEEVVTWLADALEAA